MKVWSVVQVVHPNHNTSYDMGENWEESHDSEAAAVLRAEWMNGCRSPQCIGVEYIVVGPHDETEVFEGL